MTQIMKALKNRQTNKIVILFPQPNTEFTKIDHELITVAVTEIKSYLCASCSGYDDCRSGIRGNDHDCSSYESKN